MAELSTASAELDLSEPAPAPIATAAVDDASMRPRGEKQKPAAALRSSQGVTCASEMGAAPTYLQRQRLLDGMSAAFGCSQGANSPRSPRSPAGLDPP